MKSIIVDTSIWIGAFIAKFFLKIIFNLIYLYF
jgi:hypothetical protein